MPVHYTTRASLALLERANQKSLSRHVEKHCGTWRTCLMRFLQAGEWSQLLRVPVYSRTDASLHSSGNAIRLAMLDLLPVAIPQTSLEGASRDAEQVS
jgi:hypothetical protein